MQSDWQPQRRINDRYMEEILASDSLFPARRPSGDGILPSQEIRQFVDAGIINSPGHEISDDQIQPASIDLRLSNEAYVVRASFLPGKSTTLLTKATTNGMLSKTIDISKPTVFEPRVIYIIPLIESLALPSDVYGVANPKSTTGRLDIFTRLITEYGDEFERVRRGYRGRLYIEVISHTFPIIVQGGMKLNQLRFGRGKFVVVGDGSLRQLDQDDSLIHADEDNSQTNIDRGVRVHIDLKGNGSEVVGYQAKKNSPAIDLSKIDYYEISDFWTPILRNDMLQFILEPGAFYILASKERVRVPPTYAAEMLPYDLATQEFRVHYAGFFDPGFGYGIQGEIPATKAVLEVRASEMRILLEDNQFVGRLNYYKMGAPPLKVYGGSIGSSYQQQGLALSKQFKREPQHAAGLSHSAASAGMKTREGSGTQTLENDDEDGESNSRFAFPDGTSGERRVDAKNR